MKKIIYYKKKPDKNKSKLSKPSSKVKSRRRKKKKGSSPLLLILGLIVALFVTFVLFSVTGNKTEEAKALKETVTVKKETIVKKTVKKKIEPKVLPIQKTVKEEETIKEQKPPEIKIKPVVDRAAIKDELLPPDLNFDPLVDKLDEYIELTDSKSREIEEEKIEFVSTYRDHLLIHFYKKPYTGIFYLHKQKPFRATLVKANETNIHLKVLNTGKPLVISWKDFELNQFDEFANYYAAGFSNDFSLSENNKAVFHNVAQEYAKLAVFLDWYGFKDKAVAFKHRSLKFNPGMLDKLNLLIDEESMN